MHVYLWLSLQGVRFDPSADSLRPSNQVVDRSESNSEWKMCNWVCDPSTLGSIRTSRCSVDIEPTGAIQPLRSKSARLLEFSLAFPTIGVVRVSSSRNHMGGGHHHDVKSLFDVARQQLTSSASGSPPGYPRVWRGSCTYGAVRPPNLLGHRRSGGSRSGALRAAPYADWPVEVVQINRFNDLYCYFPKFVSANWFTFCPCPFFHKFI